MDKVSGKLTVFEELTADERFKLEDLQNAGRHISQKHYQTLIDKLNN